MKTTLQHASDDSLSAYRSIWGVLALITLAAIILAASAWWGYSSRTTSQSFGWEVHGPQVPPRVSDDPGSPTSGHQSGKPLASTASPQRAASAPVPSGVQPELEWPLWEFRLREPLPPRVPPLTPPSWRLVGATLASGTWSVLVLQQARSTPEFFTVGQELPGGYRIEHIDDEAVTLVKSKRKLLLSYMNAR